MGLYDASVGTDEARGVILRLLLVIWSQPSLSRQDGLSQANALRFDKMKAPTQLSQAGGQGLGLIPAERGRMLAHPASLLFLSGIDVHLLSYLLPRLYSEARRAVNVYW